MLTSLQAPGKFNGEGWSTWEGYNLGNGYSWGAEHMLCWKSQIQSPESPAKGPQVEGDVNDFSFRPWRAVPVWGGTTDLNRAMGWFIMSYRPMTEQGVEPTSPLSNALSSAFLVLSVSPWLRSLSLISGKNATLFCPYQPGIIFDIWVEKDTHLQLPYISFSRKWLSM